MYARILGRVQRERAPAQTMLGMEYQSIGGGTIETIHAKTIFINNAHIHRCELYWAWFRQKKKQQHKIASSYVSNYFSNTDTDSLLVNVHHHSLHRLNWRSIYRHL